MVLEATMICIDNSEWMRNGDYSPTRFQAQADAVNLICGSKTQSHPENTVGILTTSGKGVRVLVTPTPDLGKILARMHGIELAGEANVTNAVLVAQLALKHRQNKHQRQRIVLFAGSPVTAEKKVLETIGKKLKKNNVALDIVDFGQEDDEKSEKLEALLAAVNSNDNSHIVHVAPSNQALADVLISSPIFEGDGEGSGFAAAAAAGAAAAAAAAAGGAGGFEFGVDPNLDPELALALRVSMEEERARQELAAKRAAEEQSPDAQARGEASAAPDVTMSDAPAAVSTEKGPDVAMEDESLLLAQALAMSMGDTGASASVSVEDTTMTEATGEEHELEMALKMSMQAANDGDMTEALGDASFVNSVLSSLPGVDPNDPSVRDVLAVLQQAEEEEKRKNESKSKDPGDKN